jgi:hypothetical protein
MPTKKYTLNIAPAESGNGLEVEIPEIGVTVATEGLTIQEAVEAGQLAIIDANMRKRRKRSHRQAMSHRQQAS